MIAQSEKASKRSGVPTLIRKIYKKCGGDDGVPLALIKKKYEQCGDGGVPPPEFMNSSGERSEEGGVEGVGEGRELVKESESVKKVIKEAIKEAKEWREG